MRKDLLKIVSIILIFAFSLNEISFAGDYSCLRAIATANGSIISIGSNSITTGTETTGTDSRDEQRKKYKIFLENFGKIKPIGQRFKNFYIASFYETLYEYIRDKKELEKVKNNIDRIFEEDQEYFKDQIEELSKKYNIRFNKSHPIVFDLFLGAAYEAVAEYFEEKYPKTCKQICIEFTTIVGKRNYLRIKEYLRISEKLKHLRDKKLSKEELIRELVNIINRFIRESNYYKESEMIFEGVFDKGQWEKDGLSNVIYHMSYPWPLPSAIRLFLKYGFAHHPTTRTLEAALLLEFQVLGTEFKEGEAAFDPSKCPCEDVNERWILMDLARIKPELPVKFRNPELVALLAAYDFDPQKLTMLYSETTATPKLSDYLSIEQSRLNDVVDQAALRPAATAAKSLKDILDTDEDIDMGELAALIEGGILPLAKSELINSIKSLYEICFLYDEKKAPLISAHSFVISVIEDLIKTEEAIDSKNAPRFKETISKALLNLAEDKTNIGEPLRVLQILQDYYVLNPTKIGKIELADLCDWLETRLQITQEFINIERERDKNRIVKSKDFVNPAILAFLPQYPKTHPIIVYDAPTTAKLLKSLLSSQVFPPDIEALQLTFRIVIYTLKEMAKAQNPHIKPILLKCIAEVFKGLAEFYINAIWYSQASQIDEPEQYLTMAQKINPDDEEIINLFTKVEDLDIMRTHLKQIPPDKLKEQKPPTQDEIQKTLKKYATRVPLYDGITGLLIETTDVACAESNIGCHAVKIRGLGVVWLKDLGAGGFRTKIREQLYPGEAVDKGYFDYLYETIIELDCLRQERKTAKESGDSKEIEAVNNRIRQLYKKAQKEIDGFATSIPGLTYRIETKKALAKAATLILGKNEPAAILALLAAKDRIAKERVILLKKRLRFPQGKERVREDKDENIIICMQRSVSRANTSILEYKDSQPFGLITKAFRYIDHAIDSEAEDYNKVENFIGILERDIVNIRTGSNQHQMIQNVIADLDDLAEQLKGKKCPEKKQARKNIIAARRLLSISRLDSAELRLKEALSLLMARLTQTSYIIDSLQQSYIMALGDILQKRNQSVISQMDSILMLLKDSQYKDIAENWLPDLLEMKYIKLEPGLKRVRLYLEKAKEITEKILKETDKTEIKRLQALAELYLEKAKTRINEARAITKVTADYRDLLKRFLLGQTKGLKTINDVFERAYQFNLRYLDYIIGPDSLKRLKLFHATSIPHGIKDLASKKRIDNPDYLQIFELIGQADAYIEERESAFDVIQRQLYNNPLYHKALIQKAIKFSETKLAELKKDPEIIKRTNITKKLDGIIGILNSRDILTSTTELKSAIEQLKGMLGWAFPKKSSQKWVKNARSKIYPVVKHLEYMLPNVERRNQIITEKKLDRRARNDSIFVKYAKDYKALSAKLSQIKERKRRPRIVLDRGLLSEIKTALRKTMQKYGNRTTVKIEPVHINGVRHHLLFEQAA